MKFFLHESAVTYGSFTVEGLLAKSWQGVCWVSASSKFSGHCAHWNVLSYSIDSICGIITVVCRGDRVFEVKVSLWNMLSHDGSIKDKKVKLVGITAFDFLSAILYKKETNLVSILLLSVLP